MIEYHTKKGKSTIIRVLIDQDYGVKAIMGGHADKLDWGEELVGGGKIGFIYSEKAWLGALFSYASIW